MSAAAAHALARVAIVLALACAAPVAAQTIYKCKAPDGRITYTSTPCAPDQAAPAAAGSAPARTEVAPKGAEVEAKGAGTAGDEPAVPQVQRAPLPKECDNAASLQYVVARLDSPTTPNDIRDFLAAERFRLLRCEFTRFTSDERRERDAAMRDLDARDAARRKAAVARIEALYDRYLTPAERAARARSRTR